MKYILALLLVLVTVPVYAGNPYKLGGSRVTPSVGNPYKLKGYQPKTVIHNPYGVRNGDPYKYAWKRRNGYTSIVVYPDFDDRVNIYNVKEPDHWERARSNYFQQMYGPNGVYSPNR